MKTKGQTNPNPNPLFANALVQNVNIKIIKKQPKGRF